MEGSKLKKGFKYISDPDYRFLVNAYRGKYDEMPDEEYIRRLYRGYIGRDPDLQDPKTFGEKLQWLKLHDHDPLYTRMADKLEMRKIVEEKLGRGYTVPLLGVYESPEDIDFDGLPDRFVLKCNHNSGRGMCICRDKSRLDPEKVRRDLQSGLQENYFLTGREWPYKNIQRKILCEEFLEEDSAGSSLTDYKFYCFNGEPKLMYLSQECVVHSPQSFFDMDFKKLDIIDEDPPSEEDIPEPACFREMQRIAGIFARGIPFLRVDFYCIQGRIYVGEFTFFHNSGFQSMRPEHWERDLGDLITLPKGNA